MTLRMILATTAVAACCTAFPALAEAGSKPPAAANNDAPDCLQLYRIDHTKILDDSTILFHMKGGETYVSKLPYRCHGLKFEGGFAYSTSIPQLCGKVDFITVIRRGNACPLGPFQYYTPEEKKDEKAAKPKE